MTDTSTENAAPPGRDLVTQSRSNFLAQALTDSRFVPISVDVVAEMASDAE
jgi:hypothetical protein